MKLTFGKGIAIGAVAAAVALAAGTAAAGDGVGGIFNLGVANTVDALSVLKGTTASDQLRVNNQSPNDAAVAVHGIHSAASGIGAGVVGETKSSASNSAGVRGIGGSCGYCVGVHGKVTGNGIGVRGETPAGSGNSWGVEGIGGASGVGVFGHTPPGSATSYGVRGDTLSTSPYGAAVFGFQGATSGLASAVRGQNNSATPNAAAILGQATATDPGRDVVAVRGISKSTNSYGMGVWGSTDGSGWGVLGESPNGAGVVGKSGSGYAVWGQATGSSGYAFAAEGDARQSRAGGGWVKAMAVIDPNLPAGQQVARCYNSQAVPATPSCGITASGLDVGIWRVDFGFNVSDRFVLLTPFYGARGSSHGIVANAYPVGGSFPTAVNVSLAYNGGEFTNVRFFLFVF